MARPVAVGWLKDMTRSFSAERPYSAGLLYSSALLVVGALVVAALPIQSTRKPV